MVLAYLRQGGRTMLLNQIVAFVAILRAQATAVRLNKTSASRTEAAVTSKWNRRAAGMIVDGWEEA